MNELYKRSKQLKRKEPKDERVVFWLVHNSFQIHSKESYDTSRFVWTNVVLIKTNQKTTQNHQSKTMLLFKTYTLEFEFDRHLEHMVICQGFQSVSCWWIQHFRDFYAKNDCLIKPDFFIFLQLQTSEIDHIWTDKRRQSGKGSWKGNPP